MKLKWLPYLLLVTVIAAALHSCANIGAPEGGPVDYTPPRFVKSSPTMGALEVKGNKIELTFDEIVNIKDQQKKVVVSPAQKSPPVIRTLGKKVTVEFRDTLLPNTTYCIDFTNAIEDNNEGNPLEDFAFSFSTGKDIDSLQISGIVLRAKDLEPMQHLLVGLHSNLSDTAFTRTPFERIARTNDRGQFTLRSLKPGRYHLFALNDIDGDYRMARTEDIAFLDEVIVPSASVYTSQDTVFTFDHRLDTVVTAQHTMFKPNDLLLSMFNEGFKSLYLKTTARTAPDRLHVLFSAPSDSMPRLNIIRPAAHAEDWGIVERTPGADSIYYWLTDSALIKADTIVVAMDYLRTDTTDHRTWTTDTVKFAMRKSNSQLKEEQEERKEREKLEKKIAKLREKQSQGKELNEEEEELLNKADNPDIPRLKVECVKKGDIEVYDSIALHFETPLRHIDPAGIHLAIMKDSIWVPVEPIPQLAPPDECNVKQYNLPMTLEPGQDYQLKVDSLAITSIHDLQNDPFTAEFKVRELDAYSNLYVNVAVDCPAFVELLDNKGEALRQSTVINGTAQFLNVLPNSYYLRLVRDINGNGKWDTGNYASHLQPEEVYYYPKAVKLRANWDIDQSWDIYATPVDKQKPENITKNRPEATKNKLKAKQEANRKKKPNSGDDEEEDEFNSNGFTGNVYSGNKYQDYQNNRRR